LFGAGASAQDAGNYPTDPFMMIVRSRPAALPISSARLIQHGVGQILGSRSWSTIGRRAA